MVPCEERGIDMRAVTLLVIAVMLLPLFVPVSVFGQNDADGDAERPEKPDKPRRPDKPRWGGGGERPMGQMGDRRPMGRQNGDDQRGKWRRMKELDPETMKRIKKIQAIEKECKKLAMQYRKAKTDEEKQKIKKELEAAVSKLFDLRILIQQKGVERLEKRLQELKDLLAKRVQAREEVIDRRLDQLTGETKHLEW